MPGARADAVASVVDRAIPGPGGLPGLRVYTPRGGSGPFPLLVFFHGGGFVVCGLGTHDALCRNLCAGAGCVVASVGYRLAPEHRFPAAPDDCLAALRWAAGHAAELGADPARVAVGGDSAGGHLAAVTALRARDEGGPRLVGQLLLYPTTDAAAAGMPSLIENPEGYGLTARDMAWFSRHYLADPADAGNPHASPLRAADLRGLPPALVQTAEYDPLRDGGEAYGARLREAGVPTTVSRLGGMIHGFLFFPGVVGAADAALDEACAWLRGAFAGRGWGRRAQSLPSRSGPHAAGFRDSAPPAPAADAGRHGRLHRHEPGPRSGALRRRAVVRPRDAPRLRGGAHPRPLPGRARRARLAGDRGRHRPGERRLRAGGREDRHAAVRIAVLPWRGPSLGLATGTTGSSPGGGRGGSAVDRRPGPVTPGAETRHGRATVRPSARHTTAPP